MIISPTTSLLKTDELILPSISIGVDNWLLDIEFSTTKLLLSIGFIYQTIYSSNDTFQISKVFWHDARIIHSIIYLLATYYFYINDVKMATILLITDIVFSIIYRIIERNFCIIFF